MHHRCHTMTEKSFNNVVPLGTAKHPQKLLIKERSIKALKMRPLSQLEKNNRTKRLQEILNKDPYFFASRWISRYIVTSIELCGDTSLAFDLMKGDAKP